MVMGPVQMMADNGPSSFPFSSRFPAAMARPAADGRSRVRRCLFGTRVPGESEAFVRREAEEQMENDSRRYNFDFKNEKPFAPAENQRFVWSQVASNTDERVLGNDNGNNVNQPGNEETSKDSAIASSSGVCGSRLALERQEDVKSNVNIGENASESSKITRPNAKFVQTKLSDYMKSRKRTQSVSTATGASKHASDSSTITPGALSDSTPVKVRRTSTTF